MPERPAAEPAARRAPIPSEARKSSESAPRPGHASRPLPPEPAPAAKPSAASSAAASPSRQTAQPKPGTRPKPVRASASRSGTRAVSPGFYVQVGAFRDPARARALAGRLKRRGFSARIVAKAGGLHAVWAGPRSSRSEAETLKNSIQLKAGLSGFIVQRR